MIGNIKRLFEDDSEAVPSCYGVINLLILLSKILKTINSSKDDASIEKAIDSIEIRLEHSKYCKNAVTSFTEILELSQLSDHYPPSANRSHCLWRF